MKHVFTLLKAWSKNHKTATSITTALLVITIAGAGIFIAGCRSSETDSTSTSSIEEVEETSEEVEEITEADLTIIVTADMDWTVDSTPAFAYIEGEIDDEEISLYTAIYATEEGNYGESTVTLPLGTYTVSFISPVNEDGSAYLYEMSDNVEVTVVAVTEDDADETEETSEVSETEVTSESSVEESDEADEVNTVYCEMTKINAEDVTDEMLAEIVTEIRTALDTDDSILEESTVEEFVTKLESNVSANPNASETTIANVGAIITGEVVETASESTSEEETSENTGDDASDASASDSGSTSGSTSSGTTSSGASSSGSTSSSSTNSGSSSSGSSSSGSSSSGSSSSGSTSSGSSSSGSTSSGSTSSGSSSSGSSSSGSSSSTSECSHNWETYIYYYDSFYCLDESGRPVDGCNMRTEPERYVSHLATCTNTHTSGRIGVYYERCTICGYDTRNDDPLVN